MGIFSNADAELTERLDGSGTEARPSNYSGFQCQTGKWLARLLRRDADSAEMTSRARLAATWGAVLGPKRLAVQGSRGGAEIFPW